MHSATGSGIGGRGLEVSGVVRRARVRWAIGCSLSSPDWLTATVGGTMSTLGNVAVVVSVVCTLRDCRGVGGGGPMSVVFFRLGVVGSLETAMVLGFF